MSTIKRGITVVATEWRKHLRKWGRRAFWKRQRADDRRTTKQAKQNNPCGGCADPADCGSWRTCTENFK